MDVFREIRKLRMAALLLCVLLFMAAPLQGQDGWKEDVYQLALGAKLILTHGDSIYFVRDGLNIANSDLTEYRKITGSPKGIRAMVSDGQRLMVTTGYEGLYMRQNGHERLTWVPTIGENISSLLFHRDTLFLIGSRNLLYYSTDFGASLNLVDDSLEISQLLFSDGETMFGRYNNHTIRSSIDGGAHWYSCDLSYVSRPSQLVRHRNRLFIANEHHQKMKMSTDHGVHWNYLTDLPVDPRSDGTRRYPFIDGILSMTADDEALYICTGIGVFRSSDFGSSWDTLSHGDKRFRTLYKGPACLLAGDGGVSSRYLPDTQQWGAILMEWGWAQLELSFAGNFLSDGTRFSPDEGATWYVDDYRMPPPAYNGQHRLYRFQRNDIDSSFMLTSDDFGRSWAFADSLPFGTVGVAANASTYAALFSGNGLKLLMVDLASGQKNLSTVDVHGESNSFVYLNDIGQTLVDAKSRWFFSSSYGTDWESLDAQFPDDVIHAVLTRNSVFVETENDIYTRTGGGSWTSIEAWKRLDQPRITAAWRHHLCLIGQDSLYLCHETTGAWTAIALPDLLRGYEGTLQFAGTDRYLFVVTPGKEVLFKRRLDQTLSAAEAHPAVPFSLQIRDVHPQPASSVLFLQLESAVDSQAELILHDLSGRIVMRQHCHIPAGTETVLLLDVGAVPPGSYMLSTTEGHTFDSRLIIVAR